MYRWPRESGILPVVRDDSCPPTGGWAHHWPNRRSADKLRFRQHGWFKNKKKKRTNFLCISNIRIKELKTKIKQQQKTTVYPNWKATPKPLSVFCLLSNTPKPRAAQRPREVAVGVPGGAVTWPRCPAGTHESSLSWVGVDQGVAGRFLTHDGTSICKHLKGYEGIGSHFVSRNNTLNKLYLSHSVLLPTKLFAKKLQTQYNS